MGDRLYLERFVWFDSQVRGGRYPNATSLAEAFECTVKMAQRAIETFRDRFGAPLKYDTSRRGYLYEDPDYRLPVTQLSETKLLAERLLGAVAPEAAFSFRWSAVTPSDVRYLSDGGHRPDHASPLSFRYYSPHTDVCTTRSVEPHHMVNYQGAWHLIAWCRLREGWRDFVLARMSGCEIESTPFMRREASQWHPFLEVG